MVHGCSSACITIPIYAVQGEMGLTPPEVSRSMETFRLWNHLTKLPSYRLPSIIFNITYRNKSAWCSQVQNNFQVINLQYNFQARTEIDLISTRNLLMNNYETKFLDSIKTKPKLRTYCKFKSSYNTEVYLQKLSTRQKKSIFAQLRIGILPLRIETGRFINLKVEERLCLYCNKNVIEDEVHFVTECDKYLNLRSKFYEQCSQICTQFATFTNDEKFYFILNNTQICQESVNFIFNAFNIRKNEE